MSPDGDGCNTKPLLDEWEERVYRSIVDEFPANIVLAHAREGRVVRSWVGTGVAEIYGYGVEEMQQDTMLWLSTVHPDDSERVKAGLKRMFEGEAVVDEYRIFRKDGQMRWVRESCAVHPHCDGDSRILVFVEDITDYKQAQEDLAQSERFLRSVLDGLTSHVAVLDRQGVITAVNEAWRRFARENDHRSVRTGVGVNYLQVCREARGPYSEGAAEALEGLQAILEGRSTDLELEYYCPTPESDRWFAMRAAPIAGDIGGAVVSHIDITARKHAEEALRAREESYRTLVDNIDAVIFRLTPDLEPVLIYGHAQDISGYSAEELLRQPSLWMDSVHPDDRELARSRFREVAERGRPKAAEVRLLVRDGSTKWVRSYVTPHYDQEHNLTFYDGVGVEVTELVESRLRDARYAVRMAALSGLSRELLTSLDFAGIVSIATREVSELLDCVAGVIAVDPVNGASHHLVIHHREQENAERIRYHSQRLGLDLRSAFGATEAGSRITPDLAAVSPDAARFAEAAGVGPAMLVPIRLAGEGPHLFGCLRFVGQEPFDDDDLWLLEQVSSHVSAALANAKLFRRQARIAETLQRSLIPREARVAGYDIATCYSPALGEAEVGGDFYDIIEFDNGVVGLVAGDVSGKGVDAAIHTAETKYMLRGFALEDNDPKYVINAVNRGLCRFIGEFSFVTLVYALVDPASHCVRYVNAGHEAPLLLCTETGLVHELKPSGPVLGVDPRARFRADSALLEPDDFLFCYTDGITDVPRDSDRFGYERLLETVASAKVEESEQLMAHVVAAVREYGGGSQPDDQVVVVVRTNR